MRVLLVSSALLALAACGQPAPDSSDPTTSSPASRVEAPEAEDRQEDVAELPAPYNQANYQAGRRVFAQCRSCHTIDPDAPNRVGPNLHGVFGREIGSLPGFNYSRPALDANFVWDASHLDNWLANPQTFLPGNRMAFAGVRDATQRRDLIAYLMLESEPED